MLYKTEGIVLHSIKYGETSLIVYVYTVGFGRQSYLINGVRKKKSKIKMNLFQPLSLLNLEVYYKPKRELQRIKEIQIQHVFTTIPFDFKKKSIAIFLAEILYKTLQEEESNPGLFQFLSNTIQYLDVHEEGIANFHIYFLLQYTKFIGFFPENNFSIRLKYFDTKQGSFSSVYNSPFTLSEKISFWIQKFLACKLNEIENIEIDHLLRNEILEGLIQYYKYYVDGMSEIKSFAVLTNVFE